MSQPRFGPGSGLRLDHKHWAGVPPVVAFSNRIFRPGTSRWWASPPVTLKGVTPKNWLYLHLDGQNDDSKGTFHCCFRLGLTRSFKYGLYLSSYLWNGMDSFNPSLGGTSQSTLPTRMEWCHLFPDLDASSRSQM